MSISIKVSKVLGLASLLAVGGALALAGCDGSSDDDVGGAGGQGGDPSTGGSASGGASGCDPVFGGAGGGGGAGGAGSDAVAIQGTYTDQFGSQLTIGAEAIESFDDVFTYLEVDAEARTIIAENGENNAFNPGLFSRFTWFFEGGSLYYCQEVYGAESAEDAADAEPADKGDLDEGCGGFAWSKLTVPCE